MLSHLYSYAWLLLQFIADCYDLLRWFLLLLQATYLKSYDLLRSRGESQALLDIAFLERCKLELSKIPSHLSIIIGPESVVGAELLTRIIIYAINMDIDCISFYDTRPTSPEGRQRGATIEQIRPPKYVTSKKLHDNKFLWSMSSPELANGKKAANGACNGSPNSVYHKTENMMEKSIEVVMLSAKDGRPQIAEVCQELYQQRQTKEIQHLLKDRTLLMERINLELARKLNHLPDPELAIIFNDHTCTFGLLPWQTRFTEFHTVETGRYFNVETFAKLLYRYSRCEQRWGK